MVTHSVPWQVLHGVCWRGGGVGVGVGTIKKQFAWHSERLVKLPVALTIHCPLVVQAYFVTGDGEGVVHGWLLQFCVWVVPHALVLVCIPPPQVFEQALHPDPQLLGSQQLFPHTWFELQLNCPKVWVQVYEFGTQPAPEIVLQVVTHDAVSVTHFCPDEQS